MAEDAYQNNHREKTYPIPVWATLWITLGTSRQIRAGIGFPHDAHFLSNQLPEKIQIHSFYE